MSRRAPGVDGSHFNQVRIQSTVTAYMLIVNRVIASLVTATPRPLLGCQWSSSTIPYEATFSLVADDRLLSAIESGMRVWEKQTCVRFVPAKGRENQFLLIEKDSAKCDANVGTCSMETDAATGRQFNRLSVGRCILKDSKWILHELGHVIGLIHQADGFRSGADFLRHPLREPTLLLRIKLRGIRSGIAQSPSSIFLNACKVSGEQVDREAVEPGKGRFSERIAL